MMRTEYFKRFNLSEDDIKHTLGSFPESVLYQMAIHFGIHLPTAAAKMEYAKEKTIRFKTRYNVVENIIAKIKPQLNAENNSTVLVDRGEHTPSLPQVHVSEPEFRRAFDNTPEAWNFFNTLKVEHLFTYEDILLVALERWEDEEAEAVLMHRVIPEDEWKDFGENMLTKAARCVWRDKRYVITEEACWFI